MNGTTRAPLSPPTTRWSHITWTNSPRTSVGERRPCGALLQPVVAVWLRMQRVAGSLRSQSSGIDGGNVVTPAIRYRTANPFLRDIGRWAVRLGRHPLEKYRGGPKIGSSGTELRCWGQSQKPVWLDLQWYEIQRRKPGLAIHHVPTIGGWWWQKSYPRDNRLVAGESSYRPRGLVHSMSALPILVLQQEPRVGLLAH